jgi:hypothetical protein
MQLLIVLVNYNGFDLTVDCLDSLRSELEALPDAHVGLCDNGSGEKEVQRLADAIEELGLSDRVTLSSVFPNRGFTGGNNDVIRKALAESPRPAAILLLNNDTLVPTGAIQQLLAFFQQHPEVAVCGSRLEYPDGQSQRAARRTLTFLSELEAYARIGLLSKLLSPWSVAPPERNEPHTCGWVPGAALLIRCDVFDQIGLLDEDLYTYFDDVDFCLRAERAGWPTWYVPASRIVHLVGKTTGVTETETRPQRRPSYWFWARRHYFLKNFGPWHATLADLAAIMGLCLWKLRLIVGNRSNPDPPHLLTDLVRHSVFRTGYRIRPVVNPALAESNQQASRLRPSVPTSTTS